MQPTRVSTSPLPSEGKTDVSSGDTNKALWTFSLVSNTATDRALTSVIIQETTAYTANGNLTNCSLHEDTDADYTNGGTTLLKSGVGFASEAADFNTFGTPASTMGTTKWFYHLVCDVSGAAPAGSVTMRINASGDLTFSGTDSFAWASSFPVDSPSINIVSTSNFAFFKTITIDRTKIDDAVC